MTQKITGSQSEIPDNNGGKRNFETRLEEEPSVSEDNSAVDDPFPTAAEESEDEAEDKAGDYLEKTYLPEENL